MDEIVAEQHGLFGIDYAKDNELYQQYLDEADEILQQRYEQLLKTRQHIVLDRSFWAKEDRIEHKSKADSFGATWRLIYLKAEKDFLWQRITSRAAEERNANSALDITPEIFEKYWIGFERPEDEGEITVEVVDDILCEN